MGRKHHKVISFVVSDAESAAIKERMATVHMTNMSAYIRKMAIDGYFVNIDLTDIQEAVRLIGTCSNNINQVAKVANETRSIYEPEVIELQRKSNRLFEEGRKMLIKLAKLND
jgi:hypothetical protein